MAEMRDAGKGAVRRDWCLGGEGERGGKEG